MSLKEELGGKLTATLELFEKVIDKVEDLQQEIDDIRRELRELTHTVEMVDAGIPRDERWRF